MTEDEGIGSASDVAREKADGQLESPLNRRRRSRPTKHHRHRDLSPEEDNRRRQRVAVAKMLLGILAVIGAGSWIAGIWNVDEYQHHPKLIRVGQVFLLLGGGFFTLLLIREWAMKLRSAYKDRRERAARDGLPASHRSRRRKHRSAKPSGLRIK